MRLVHFIAFLALLFLSTPLAAEETLDDHSVILFGPDCQRIFDQMSRSAPSAKEGVWTPTPEQVNALWKVMPDLVAGPPKLLYYPLDGFHRQYVGFVREGHQFIYLNAFPMRFNFDRYWRKHPIIVGDGGSHYFGVEYDVERSQILNFASNGL